MFKIRNKNTGQFSSGGAYPRWTKRGKIWYALHHLRAHMKSNAAYKREFYKDAEIVVYEIEISTPSTRPIDDVMEA